jgi:hypothetical protein
MRPDFCIYDTEGASGTALNARAIKKIQEAD